MGFLFGERDTPQPAAVPQSPLESEEAQRQRRAAEDAALSAERASGRKRTVVGGMTIAQEDQQNLMAAKKRGVARELVG